MSRKQKETSALSLLGSIEAAVGQIYETARQLDDLAVDHGRVFTAAELQELRARASSLRLTGTLITEHAVRFREVHVSRRLLDAVAGSLPRAGAFLVGLSAVVGATTGVVNLIEGTTVTVQDCIAVLDSHPLLDSADALMDGSLTLHDAALEPDREIPGQEGTMSAAAAAALRFEAHYATIRDANLTTIDPLVAEHASQALDMFDASLRNAGIEPAGFAQEEVEIIDLESHRNAR